MRIVFLITPNIPLTFLFFFLLLLPTILNSAGLVSLVPKDRLLLSGDVIS